jgi:molybdopterin molybdotransferase
VNNEHIHIHKHVDEDMLSVEAASENILKSFIPLSSEQAPILTALGQVLHSNIYSQLELPPSANSGMDGYAVVAEDLTDYDEDAPIVLQVIGTIPAGEQPTLTVRSHTAARIMTGATIPDGATAVVPFEETDETERKAKGMELKEIGIKTRVYKGANIREAGEDVHIGDLILSSGTVIRQQEIAVIASLGIPVVDVIKKPVISVISTGNELVELNSSLNNSQIYDSNSYGICAAVESCGGIANRVGIARDSIEELEDALNRCSDSDMIITSAGVSKGDYDVVKDVLQRNGNINFWSVKMRPAKPLAFGIITLKGKNIPLIGLPGNPVSALVAFEMFGRPSILKMLGKQNLVRPTVQGKLNGTINNFDGRRVYARVEVINIDGEFIATPTGPQGSNILTSMAKANGLAICPEDETSKNDGETVSIIMINWNEEVII